MNSSAALSTSWKVRLWNSPLPNRPPPFSQHEVLKLKLIIIRGVSIPTVPNPKILAIVRDSSLKFGKQAEELSKQLEGRNRILRTLAGTTWGKSKETIATTYKLVIPNGETSKQGRTMLWGQQQVAIRSLQRNTYTRNLKSFPHSTIALSSLDSSYLRCRQKTILTSPTSQDPERMDLET